MNTTLGVFSSTTQADAAIVALNAMKIENDDISYIYKNKDGDIKDEQTGEKIGDGAKAGATTGAVIGAIAGLVVANGILPGIGTLFVAGPLATALGLTGAAATTVAGAVTGAAAGGIIGALTNLGVDKADAELYENHIKSGDVLVVVRSEMDGVRMVLEDNGAKEIREYHTA